MGSVVEGATSILPTIEIPPVIAAALVEIQKTLKPMKRTSNNGEYDSKYTPLEEMMPKAHKLLTKHKIAVSQPPVTLPTGEAALTTILVHESGVSYQTTTKIAVFKPDPQVHGSAITYMRRYALGSTLGITTEGEDDDGNLGSGKFPKPSEDQLKQIRAIMVTLKQSAEHIAAELRKIHTRDHASAVIRNLNELISKRERVLEARDRAEVIANDPEPDDTGSQENPLGDLEERMVALGLDTKALRNKFAMAMVRKPFLANCTAEDLGVLDMQLKWIENGAQTLPLELLKSIPVTEEGGEQKPNEAHGAGETHEQ
ncbi:ERF family protein [Nocardia sp. NPDC055165]